MGIAIANPAQAAQHKTSSGREDGVEEGGSKESDIGWFGGWLRGTVGESYAIVKVGWPRNAVSHTNLVFRYLTLHSTTDQRLRWR
jgi:hypothetical protein